jgi:hypothetical protein
MPSNNTLRKLRRQAAQKQTWLCFYCRLPTWDAGPTEFLGQYAISPGLAKRFQCTAEHLEAKCDGGKDVQINIVAACIFCNATRHKAKNPLNATKHAAVVRLRMAKGKWHPPQVMEALAKRKNAPSLSKTGFTIIQMREKS